MGLAYHCRGAPNTLVLTLLEIKVNLLVLVLLDYDACIHALIPMTVLKSYYLKCTQRKTEKKFKRLFFYTRSSLTTNITNAILHQTKHLHFTVVILCS